ncbi:MAG TPA: MFS transporter [Gemmatimonadales bacterium]|nr:MFS transporter [Gemmatimonadales bacterium]
MLSGTSLRILRERNFALYFIGNLSSNCGTWFQVIAQSLFVYRLTGSTLLVGVTNFALFIGVVLLAPWAGPAADRYDRRLLLILTQVGATLVSAALALLIAVGWGSLPVVVGLALLLGLTTAFATPAMQAIVPALVRREDLGAAVAMNSVTFNLSRAIGGPLGALVVAQLGVAAAIGLNAISYVILIVMLLLVKLDPAQRRAPPTKEQPKLRDSVRMVSKTPHLALLLATVMAASLTMDPVMTVTPEFSKQIFHRADVLTGYLIGAFGLGAVLASVFPVHRPKDRSIAILFVVFGAGMVAFALSPALAPAFVALAIGGAGYLAGQTRATTRLQLDVGEHERGRIMALWSVAFLGSRPIASLIDGGVASLAGPRVATIVMALPAFFVALLLFRGKES